MAVGNTCRLFGRNSRRKRHKRGLKDNIETDLKDWIKLAQDRVINELLNSVMKVLVP
jgi:hypothetical protein